VEESTKSEETDQEFGLGRTVQRKVRNYIASACFAIAITSFISFLWMFQKYAYSIPEGRQPQLGRVYPQNNHGSIVYLTKKEETGQSLLQLAWWCGLLAGGIIVPKNYTAGKNATNDLTHPSREYKYVALATAVVYFAIIDFAGQHIVDLVIANGMIPAWAQ
jgi:hypothetical protein